MTTPEKIDLPEIPESPQFEVVHGEPCFLVCDPETGALFFVRISELSATPYWRKIIAAVASEEWEIASDRAVIPTVNLVRFEEAQDNAAAWRKWGQQ